MTGGYRPKKISTLVDKEATNADNRGYRPKKISTLVDWNIYCYQNKGYRPKKISTLVDSKRGEWVSNWL